MTELTQPLSLPAGKPAEVHNMHNYSEFEHVFSTTKALDTPVAYWARYGLFRVLHRHTSWIRANLGFPGSDLTAVERESYAEFLRFVDPIIARHEEDKSNLPTWIERIGNYQAIEDILQLVDHADEALLYWAKQGVALGLESGQFLARQVQEGKLPTGKMKLSLPDLNEFETQAAQLLSRYPVVIGFKKNPALGRT